MSAKTKLLSLLLILVGLVLIGYALQRLSVITQTGDIYLISVTPDKTTVVLGEQVVFTGELTHVYGTVTPVVGAGISLNYYVSTDPWHTVGVGSATTDSEGKYTISWVADKVGDLTFFVNVPEMGSLSPFADCYVTVKEKTSPTGYAPPSVLRLSTLQILGLGASFIAIGLLLILTSRKTVKEKI